MNIKKKHDNSYRNKQIDLNPFQVGIKIIQENYKKNFASDNV